MSRKNPTPSSEPKNSSHEGKESHKSGSVMIARIVGILSVAGGFILGIQGLEQPGSPLLPTALGMIVAGVLAQIFALGRSWYLYSQRSS